MLFFRAYKTVILEMRNGKKLRTNGSAKKAAHLTTRRRQARKRNAAPKTPELIVPKMPVVEASASQAAESSLPFLFWPAFPIAMMHIWLGPRVREVRK